ncbi:GreA/GreB family elongation factor [Mangrovimonas yunxiaonensis]|uniref:GreA/GreB family elongation factor n=1 Tax=Mangrovimonas yunxiaonensis TaxID=1197477 RepID=A0A084TJJ2_9FLAO|nr:GreA/GreB family elongation factor [Mangrovimonas yunxiaonensis]KFB00878.1 GreA/GreB family elongation factor [Mangrovimonas yunxiaonensis]MBR9757824.1 GreA/GreB family elongation factor [Algicola sp.]GGH43892.1 hypothetical protein GCM10011364_16360 [Mangrovimonas yunxiaonensis]
MKYGTLMLEKKEFVTLKRLLNLSAEYKEDTRKYSVKRLAEELKNAKVVDESDFPEDVVRFNSLVTVSTEDNGWETTFQLVLPTESHAAMSRVSVLAPMGSAVMGYAKNDTMEWEFPAGVKTLKIKNVQHKIEEEIQL